MNKKLYLLYVDAILRCWSYIINYIFYILFDKHQHGGFWSINVPIWDYLNIPIYEVIVPY